MTPNDDPLHQIAETLNRMERLYAESLCRYEEERKEYAERQRKTDEQHEKWNKWYEDYDKNKPHRAFANLITAIATLGIFIALCFLAFR